MQNTFISIVSPRSETQPSLSCPASRIGCLKALFCEDADAHDTLDVLKDVPEKELGNVGNVEVEASPNKNHPCGRENRNAGILCIYYVYIYCIVWMKGNLGERSGGAPWVVVQSWLEDLDCKANILHYAVLLSSLGAPQVLM